MSPARTPPVSGRATSVRIGFAYALALHVFCETGKAINEAWMPADFGLVKNAPSPFVTCCHFEFAFPQLRGLWLDVYSHMLPDLSRTTTMCSGRGSALTVADAHVELTGSGVAGPPPLLLVKDPGFSVSAGPLPAESPSSSRLGDAQAMARRAMPAAQTAMLRVNM